MRRGELYRVERPHAREPKRFRVFAIVSRQALVDSRFSTIVCAPVYSARHGLTTQVDVGPDEGLRHDGSVHCDELVSLRKTQLTRCVGSLGPARLRRLDTALTAALGIDPARVKGPGLLPDGDFRARGGGHAARGPR